MDRPQRYRPNCSLIKDTSLRAPYIQIMLKDSFNDITLLNPIIVEQIISPKSADDLIQLIKTHNGPISIGGGRLSRGEQIATDSTLFIDMRTMNHILALGKEKHLITVEPGITWRELLTE